MCSILHMAKPEIQRLKKKVITEGLKYSAAFFQALLLCSRCNVCAQMQSCRQSHFNVLYVWPVLGGVRETGKSEWFLLKF